MLKCITSGVTGERASDAPFSWAEIGHKLEVIPNGEINIAQLATDLHAHSTHAEKSAFRFLAADGGTRNVSYRELAGLTDRFGNALKSLGVEKGDCVFVLCAAAFASCTLPCSVRSRLVLSFRHFFSPSAPSQFAAASPRRLARF